MIVVSNSMKSIFIAISIITLWTSCKVESSVISSIKKSIRSSISIGITSASIVFSSQIQSASAIEVPKMDECITESNPQTATQFCRQLGLDSDNRLRGCIANENCFSTSATSATKRGSPWFFIQENPADAFLTLKSAVELKELKILQVKPTNYYLLAKKNVPKQPSGASLFYEFLLRPSDKAILYHAAVDKTVFVYPLQQPVSDFGALNDMLNRIQTRGGFSREIESDMR